MTTQNTRRALTGGTLAVLAVLFVAVIALTNSLLRGAQLDLTENRLYTLSEGTVEVIGAIDEPINLYFFFSDRGTAELPQIRTYATRVRELLESIARRSGGKIRLSVIDPLPFSEEEDRAAGFGLQAVPTGPTGETIFFGLAGTNATDGQMVIPFFQPDKEAFLEYDVAKMIHGLVTSTKPVVGLMAELDIAPGFDPRTRQMRQGWAVHQSLAELFELRSLDPQATSSIDEAIKTVVVVHPKALSEDAQYALDQFVLRGGNLLVFVDPNAELDAAAEDPNNPSAAMFANRSSNLERLFKAWGVAYDPSKVVLDAENALQVQTQTGAPVRHMAILGLRAQALNQQDVVTAQLGTLNLSTAGSFRMADDASLALEPLLQSSAQASSVDAERVRFLPDPSALFADFVASGENYVLAGRLTGTAKTAFGERSGSSHLAESKQPVNILLVADTDLLSDRLWVQVQNFFGQQIMNAFANNGDFVANAVDNLTGSSALISIRGRATSARPFTTVVALRRGADDRFRATERKLNEELQETERKLNELQRARADDASMLLTPEQRAELDRFQKRKLEIRKELREVRRRLDADIEALGWKLKVINIALVPLLLTAGALGFAWWRRRRPAAA
ncbi:MAG: Gldg family protein [Pseudomonadota bacterium]